MPVSPEEFRVALGHFASAVTVVTTRLDDGNPAGITVTAFSSLSLEPPLVVVCIDRGAWLHDRLPIGKHFAVNMLSEEQEVISRLFASSQRDPFRGIGFDDGRFGSPLLHDTMANLECQIVDRVAGGDHTIVVGQVESAQVTERKPLLYFRGGYTRMV